MNSLNGQCPGRSNKARLYQDSATVRLQQGFVAALDASLVNHAKQRGRIIACRTVAGQDVQLSNNGIRGRQRGFVRPFGQIKRANNLSGVAAEGHPIAVSVDVLDVLGQLQQRGDVGLNVASIFGLISFGDHAVNRAGWAWRSLRADRMRAEQEQHRYHQCQSLHRNLAFYTEITR